MRIDVHWDPAVVEKELDALEARLRAKGRLDPALATLQELPLPLRLWRQEADGEFFVYIEDPSNGVFVGCVIFNRLIEVNRRVDRMLRSPHARLRPHYQRRGLAAQIYRRELQAGYCLLSGARQSPGAHALWQSLARQNENGYVHVADKHLHGLPAQPDPEVMDQRQTRRLLCGRGWSIERLLQLSSGHGQHHHTQGAHNHPAGPRRTQPGQSSAHRRVAQTAHAPLRAEARSQVAIAARVKRHD